MSSLSANSMEQDDFEQKERVSQAPTQPPPRRITPKYFRVRKLCEPCYIVTLFYPSAPDLSLGSVQQDYTPRREMRKRNE